MNYYNPEMRVRRPRDAAENPVGAPREDRAQLLRKRAALQKALDEIGLKPDDIRGIDDITKLPFTTKTDLRDTYPFGLFAVPREELTRIHASSGTTGKQTVVGYTANDVKVWATCAARSIVGIGGTKDDFVHVSYGYGLFTGGLGLHYGAEELGATAIPVSSGNTAAGADFAGLRLWISSAARRRMRCTSARPCATKGIDPEKPAP